ncbi:MAG: hypothetical protein PHE83_08190 [Opitutaceae bacterium]|nr:hypothetical protein [Opitutaceae bacterium]
MTGWLGDFFRFWWGLLYWNTRKSYFRLRRGRAPCPCQNPSDSGRGRETGCEAAHYWHRSSRFRRVCPLLVETPDGPRCSADAKDVRPFWRRAAAYYLGAAAGIYLAGVLIAFVFLRVIGYPLAPLTLVWPPRWHELRLARSEYFVAKAQRALTANRISEAILSLDIAFHNNPRNYGIGLQLAQLLSLGQPELADRIFALLMRDHPAQRAITAEAWLRLLLVHGRFARSSELAVARLLDEPSQRPAWLHVLFFVTRHTGDDAPLRDLVARQATRLEPIYVALINSELLIRQGLGSKLLPGLMTPLPPAAGSYGPYFQVSRLTALGHHAEALALLDRYAAAKRLPEADEFQLRLDTLAALGRDDLLRTRLGQGTINARELEFISINLVRHPDAGVLAALTQSLQRSKLPGDPQAYAARTAYFVACGTMDDWDKLHLAADMLKEISGSRMFKLETIETYFKDRSPSKRIESILPMLPALSLNMIYALYDRYEPPAPTVAVKLPPLS